MVDSNGVKYYINLLWSPRFGGCKKSNQPLNLSPPHNSSPPPPPPFKQLSSTGLSFNATTSHVNLIRYFRYASSSFEARRSGELSWKITTNINWASEFGNGKAPKTVPWPVKDQKACGKWKILSSFYQCIFQYRNYG